MPYKITANIRKEPMRTTATFSINLPYRIVRDGKYLVASCPLLDVSSFGKTKDEALAMLSEAVGLFLAGCFELGTLEQVLRESGFIKSIESIRRARQRISVPLPEPLSLRLAECLA